MMIFDANAFVAVKKNLENSTKKNVKNSPARFNEIYLDQQEVDIDILCMFLKHNVKALASHKFMD